MENQISIPDEKKEWVRQQIQAGHYPNEEAYIEDLINRDQLYQTKKAVGSQKSAQALDAT